MAEPTRTGRGSAEALARNDVLDGCWAQAGASTIFALPDAVNARSVQPPPTCASAPNHTVPAENALCSPTLPSCLPPAETVTLPPLRLIDTATSPARPEPNVLVSTALSDPPSQTATSSFPPTTPTRPLGRSCRHSS